MRYVRLESWMESTTPRIAPSQASAERIVERAIFASRWIQVPMYLGLIVGSMMYTYKFLVELLHLFESIDQISEEALLIGVLGLVDVTMVANLIFMVVLGGYSLFVSQIAIDNHEDRPEWLDKTNAATLKIKLASSLVGVSGIHLLKDFINIDEADPERLKWRVIIHGTFLVSAFVLSASERVLHPPHHH